MTKVGRFNIAATLCVVTMAVGASSGSAQPAEPQPFSPLGAAFAIEPEAECEEAVPAAAGRSGVTDDGQVVDLDVFVLLDDMPKRRAAEVMARVAESYAPLGIRVVASGYRQISVPAEPPRPEGTRPTAEMRVLFKAMRKAMGGVRPKGSDLVHLLTGKDVFYFDGTKAGYGLAGVAYCMGGVRYDRFAFSFSEGIGEYDSYRDDMAGVIAAHEIGHLMGAHHEYGNCGEGWPVRQPETPEPTPCTLMFPRYMVLNAGNFGTAEGLVVRGHAVDYASP